MIFDWQTLLFTKRRKSLDPAWVVAVGEVAGKFVLDIIVEVVVIEVKVWIEVKVGTDTKTVELRALRRTPDITKNQG